MAHTVALLHRIERFVETKALSKPLALGYKNSLSWGRDIAKTGLGVKENGTTVNDPYHGPIRFPVDMPDQKPIKTLKISGP